MVNKLENCPQLYLSEVNSNFKPERDYVLGPWCFVGREKEFPNWHELPYTDAFEQQSNKALAVKKTAELISFFV